MKVVLTKDVDKLGRSGDMKEVSDGYARNYLFPNRFALPATAGAAKIAEQQQKAAAHRQARTDAELSELAAKIEQAQVEVVVKAGEKQRIYGSVTSADIAKALRQVTGFDVDKKKVELDKPIHELGKFTATVKLSPTLSPKVNINVKGE